MANAVVTRRCNKACDFCFAPNDDSGSMSIDTLIGIADDLKANRREWIGIVGGEPTLHPQLAALMDALLERGMKVRLFSHGLLGKAALEVIERAPAERVALVINATATMDAHGVLAPGVLQTLERLRSKACLGVTIARPGRFLPLLALYDRYELRRWFRLGVAQPTLDADNAFLPDYRDPEIATVVTDLVLGLAERQIKVHYDCGFVMCMFTPAQRASLERVGMPLRSICGAMPDIAQDGLAWPCYPLSSRFTTERRPEESLTQLRRRFDGQLRGFRSSGLYPECPSCEFFLDRSCSGGCAARIIREYRPLQQRGVDGLPGEVG